MENDRNYHFALGHFCAGCPLSNVLHKDCPMVITKKETLDKPQPPKETKPTHKT